MDPSPAKAWHTARLGDVIDLFDSQRLPLNRGERQGRPGEYPYYGAQGIIDYIDDYIFDGRYILVAEDGENLNSKKLPLALFAEGKFWVNNHAHVLRGKPAVADDVFLLACLNNADIKPFVTGAAQPKLSQANLRQVEILLPPLPTQRRIAGILGAYDELIENCQRRIRILEAMARAIYREWFVHFRFPGHEKLPRVASPLGDIPKGWVVKPLKDVADVTYGFPFQSTKFNTMGVGTPVIRIRDLLDASTNTFTDENAVSKHHIKNGDILVGMDGDFHMCIWSGGHALQNQRVAKFESRGQIGNYHLFLALESPIQAWNKSIVGTTVAHLGDSHIKAIQLLWPPTALLAKTREILEPISAQVIGLKRQVKNLCTTRDLLLPRLLSGQIELQLP
jgi:type I restriction enzyme S subunit